jgi:predicted transcriptional regulator
MNDQPTIDSTEQRTLTVRVASPEEVFDDLEERFDALAAGETPEPRFEVVLQREEDLTELLRSRNLTLLRTISREEPASIRETARMVDRDVRQVHDDLTRLAELNLLRFEPNGSAKRPIVWYDDIDIELPIAHDDGTSAVA